MRQTVETAEQHQRVLVIAEQLATLLGELDALQPGSVHATAGRITGPGLEIRNSGGKWTVRTDR
ncbi:hypothetical protein OOK39_46015 [Streptomyces sp. NBC_00264]|uniref:hypothetical protein n=1 Tax=unclassified Streptomyces TaxID=2593676 RepID=UPI0022548E39|nr:MULTISPECIES: hypothetical protein [unclassified Streptomyces]MCX5166374.1 hypothetical protein [Streptomyces sp. NBC_00305]MCX5166395.1 hypothetical protein [Streptomyces sp. NBC_00305]MCX5224892.1 hypothetical protein [Streptomyces sp. NBC_00264]